jgi:hypothetical protein
VLVIVDVKNRVIVHYGTGESVPPRPWTEDHVVLHVRPPSLAFSLPQRRIGYTFDWLLILEELISESISVFDQYVSDTDEQVTSEINRAAATAAHGIPF